MARAGPPRSLHGGGGENALTAGIAVLQRRLERVADEVQGFQRESGALAALLQDLDADPGGRRASFSHVRSTTDATVVQPVVQLAPMAESYSCPASRPPLPGEVVESAPAHLHRLADRPLSCSLSTKQDFATIGTCSVKSLASKRPISTPFGRQGFYFQDLLRFQKRPSVILPDQFPHGKVFAHADAIIEVLQNRYMTQTDVLPEAGDYYYDQGHRFADIARSNIFQGLSFFVVALSSMWLAVEIDSDGDSAAQVVVSHVFCAYFVLELLVQFLAFREKKYTLKDSAFLFDFFLVVLIVLETWLLPVVYAISGSSGSGGGLRIVLVFRLLRFLKVLRLAKVIRQLPELLIIIRGIVMAYKAISFTIMLIAMTLYAGALVFTVILDGTELGAERFATVPMSVGTLLIEATLSGSKGGSVLREAHREHLLYALLLLAYVVLTNITMMGILGGLLVQAVKTVTEVEHAESSLANLYDSLEMIWELALEHDTDKDNSISLPEFETLINNEQMGQYLSSADVDLESLRECSEFIFNQNGVSGALNKAQFMHCIMDHRGKVEAKVKDHIQTRRYVYSQFRATHKVLEERLPMPLV